MPKRIASSVFGELLETGKQTVKQSKKAAGDIAQKAVKTVAGHKSSTPKRDLSGLDWLEKGTAAVGSKKKITQQQDDKVRMDQVKQLRKVDKRESVQAYKQIQEEIQIIRKRKASQPRKYVSGKADFDEEQIKDPETFFDKMKKKKEKMAKKLPWTSKKGAGTGEIRRGVSG